MPNQSTPPTFHEGCYCFRDAEAEAARAAGQLVRCGGGQPCNCIEPLPTADDALWDTIVGDVLPRGSKRPRSQCASCSCACAILHAASAAANAAAAKIRRCCGGDCRCPAGLCRCPQESVAMDTYACGALNEAIAQRVAAVLQMDSQPQPQPQPPPPPDVSAALQALQTPAPTTSTSAEIANSLQMALQGFPTIANLQQPQPLQHIQPVQPTRTGCCASSDFPVQRQQQLPDELTNGMESLHPSRTCCNSTSTKQPEANPIPSVTEAIATADLADQRQQQLPDELTNGIPSLQAIHAPRTCCGGASRKQSEANPIISATEAISNADLTALPALTQSRGAASSAGLLYSTVMPDALVTGQPGDDASRLSTKSLPPGTSPSFSTLAKSFPDSAPSTRSDSSLRSGERDRAFKCNLCDAAFKFKQNRDRHINEVHRGLRPHECDYPGCQRAFKNLSGLKQHKKTVHEKARPFKCSLCDRAFGQRNHLSQHVLVVHEKVKRYPCSFCDMAFSNVGNRTQHTKRRHPEQVQRKENEPEQLNENGT